MNRASAFAAAPLRRDRLRQFICSLAGSATPQAWPRGSLVSSVSKELLLTLANQRTEKRLSCSKRPSSALSSTLQLPTLSLFIMLRLYVR